MHHTMEEMAGVNETILSEAEVVVMHQQAVDMGEEVPDFVEHTEEVMALEALITIPMAIERTFRIRRT